MELDREIRELVLHAGGDFFGVADLSVIADAALERGKDLLEQYPRAIALGIILPDAIVDRLPQQMDADIAQEYKRVYDQANQKLDQIASAVEKRLRAAGCEALAVPASHIIDPERLYGAFSHKMAARLAGLGWIGKSCLLITPEVGPRVRWATVLTEAALSPTGQATEPACGTCRQCVDSCPAEAFTGRPFRAGEARELRFSAEKCHGYRSRLEAKMDYPVLCGICVSVCPHGKRRALKCK